MKKYRDLSSDVRSDGAEPANSQVSIYVDYLPPNKVGGLGEIALQHALQLCKEGLKVTIYSSGVAPPQQHENLRIVSLGRTPRSSVIRGSIRLARNLRQHQRRIILHQSSMVLLLPVLAIANLVTARCLRRPPFPSLDSLCTVYQTSHLHEFQYLSAYDCGKDKVTPCHREILERFIEVPFHIICDALAWTASKDIVVVSQAHKEHFTKTYGRVKRRPVRVIPNGVAERFFVNISDYELSKVNAQTRSSGEKIRIGYVGVFRHRKRLPLLLEAFKDPFLLENAELHVYGVAKHEQDSRAERLKENGVIFHGRVSYSEMETIYSTLDLLCLPSVYEGLPLVMLESLASGTRVVAVRNWGSLDVIRQLDENLLFAPDDVESLTRALRYAVRTNSNFERARAIKLAQSYLWGPISREMTAL